MRKSISVVTLAINVATSGVLCAQPYQFVKVADTSGPFQSFAAPVINSSGEVAFYARTDDLAEGIFNGADPLTSAIASSKAGLLSHFGDDPSINDSGTVAFTADRHFSGLPSRSAVLTVAGSVLNLVADAISPFRNRFSAPSINNSGMVAFVGSAKANTRGIFNGPDPVNNLVADDSTVYTFNSEETKPAINSDGKIAFYARLGNNRGIFSGPNPATDALFYPNSALDLIQDVDINDNGVLAFVNDPPVGVQGVYVGTSAAVELLTDIGGAYKNLGFPDINNLGEVAFFADLDDFGTGVFNGADPVTNKIVRSGDAIFGGTVRQIEFYRGFNNAGQVAFKYSLTSGVSGIAIASPVPEPSLLPLASIGTICSVALRRRRSPFRVIAKFSPIR